MKVVSNEEREREREREIMCLQRLLTRGYKETVRMPLYNWHHVTSMAMFLTLTVCVVTEL